MATNSSITSAAYKVKGLKQHPVLPPMVEMVKSGKLKLGKPDMNALMGESAMHLNVNSGKKMKQMSASEAKTKLTTQSAKPVSGGSSGRAPQPMTPLLTTSGPKPNRTRMN